MEKSLNTMEQDRFQPSCCCTAFNSTMVARDHQICMAERFGRTDMKPFFVTLEGIEGAGKTSIASQIDGWLTEQEIPHLVAREPGGTPAGEAIREILLNPAYPLCPQTELLLMQAARAQIMQETVLPALERHQVVILDRHTDSSIAYQGYGRGLALDEIISQNQFSTQGRIPDLTLILDIGAELGLKRAQHAKEKAIVNDRFESEALSFMQRVRKGFLKQAQSHPERYVIVSAEESLDEVWRQVREVLQQHLG